MILSPRERITAEDDWQQSYNISLGIRVGRLVFVSGQTGTHRRGVRVEPGDLAAQATLAFENIAAVLAGAGLGPADVVRTTTFVTTVEGLDGLAKVRERFFRPPYPADTVVPVTGLARPEALIEIEAVAVAG